MEGRQGLVAVRGPPLFSSRSRLAHGESAFNACLFPPLDRSRCPLAPLHLILHRWSFLALLGSRALLYLSRLNPRLARSSFLPLSMYASAVTAVQQQTDVSEKGRLLLLMFLVS